MSQLQYQPDEPPSAPTDTPSPASPNLHERAYELARELATIEAIGQRLVGEGYDDVDACLATPSLRRTLKRLLRTAARTSLPRSGRL
jgi:hypothetical protein